MDVSILTYNTHGLPWSCNRTREIGEWLVKQHVDFICLQEVFTQSNREYLLKILTRNGYKPIVPNDTDITILSSGLLTVVNKKIKVISSIFCSYENYHNVEWFANKGFHVLRCIKNNKLITIVNTHTQSNTEISWFFGEKVIDDIRKAQFKQIRTFFTGSSSPVLIVGDLNCERSPYHEIRFLNYLHNNLFHKCTFKETGEDLDHCAWIPEQYAPKGCSMCDFERYGPQLTKCIINHIDFSDHYPVQFHITLPSRCMRLS